MKKIFQDQLGREIRIPFPPKRIISLVPSQTELLFSIGLDEEVVGITKFCVHPDTFFRTKPRIGGTKKVDIDKVIALQPDLIIGNKEENEKSQIEALEQHFPLWMSDIYNLEDALDMITSVGDICGRPIKADRLVNQIRQKFDDYTIDLQLSDLPDNVRVAYFIWRKPYMVAGRATFTHSMLKLAGFNNIFASKARYPEISLEELKAAKPDVILLSSEPFPFKKKHFSDFREVCPNAKILLVDGEMFTWYGSRLLQTADYFHKLRAEI